MTESPIWDAKNQGGSFKRKIVNPDLIEERKQCNFDQKELFKFIYDEKTYNWIQEMNQLVQDHPEIMDNQLDTFDMTREEKFEFYWKRIHRIVQLKPDLILKQESGGYQWCSYFAEIVSPIYQH
jgi:hypothetical protein